MPTISATKTVGIMVFVRATYLVVIVPAARATTGVSIPLPGGRATLTLSAYELLTGWTSASVSIPLPGGRATLTLSAYELLTGWTSASVSIPLPGGRATLTVWAYELVRRIANYAIPTPFPIRPSFFFFFGGVHLH